MTTLRPVFDLPLGQINLRVQFIEVLFVESPSDGLVDIGGWGIVPEICVFLCGVETINLPGAGDGTRSVNRI